MSKGAVFGFACGILVTFVLMKTILMPKENKSEIVAPSSSSGSTPPAHTPLESLPSSSNGAKSSTPTSSTAAPEKAAAKATPEVDEDVDVRTKFTPSPDDPTNNLTVRTDGGTQGVKALAHKTVLLEGGRLKVTNGSVTYNLAPLADATKEAGAAGLEGKMIDFSPDVKEVYIEVGTNTQPEFAPMTKMNPGVMLVAFEPQPPIYDIMVSKFPAPKKQLLAIPAAITPTQSLVQMQVSEVSGCSTLLDPNDGARTFAHRAGKKAGNKAAKTQFRTVEFCAQASYRLMVPSFPLHNLLSLIPMTKTPVSILSTDAQGYDLAVASTIGIEHSKKIPIIVVECQDLKAGDRLMLVKNAPNCAEVRQCLEANFPHRLDFCYDNAPKVREVNCLYRNTLLPPYKLPPLFKMASGPKAPVFNVSEGFQCPSFAP